MAKVTEAKSPATKALEEIAKNGDVKTKAKAPAAQAQPAKPKGPIIPAGGKVIQVDGPDGSTISMVLDSEGFACNSRGERDKRWGKPYEVAIAQRTTTRTPGQPGRTKSERMADIFGKPGQFEWKLEGIHLANTPIRSITGAPLKHYATLSRTADDGEVITVNCGLGEMAAFTNVQKPVQPRTGSRKIAKKEGFEEQFDADSDDSESEEDDDSDDEESEDDESDDEETANEDELDAVLEN